MRKKRVIQIFGFLIILGLLSGCNLIPSNPPDEGETTTPTPTSNDGEDPPGDGEGDGYSGPPGDGSGYPPPPSVRGNLDNNPESETPPSVPFQTTALGDPIIIPALSESSLSQGDTAVHTVTQGEWLMQIARCYGASYTAVTAANPQLFNSNHILPNTKITVPNVGSEGPIYQRPCTSEITTASGDTWTSLAEKHGTTAELLRRANPGSLFAGRTLIVPTRQQDIQQVMNPGQDLVYVRNGNLAIWQSANGETAVYKSFDNNIVELVVNKSGRWAIAKLAQAEGDQVDIALINLAEKTIGIVEESVPFAQSAFNQKSMIINDQSAVYLTSQGALIELTAFKLDNPTGLNKLQNLNHNLPVEGTPAFAFFEGNDSNHFLLFDGSGVYRYAYGFADGEEIVTQSTEEQFFSTLRPLAWSPTGQYLLVEVFYFEGYNYGIIDATTNQWQAIQNSGGYVFAGTAVWQQNGKLDIINPWIEQGPGFTLTTYQPQTTDGNLAVTQLSHIELDTSLNLPTDLVPGTILRSAPTNDGELYLSLLINDSEVLTVNQIFRLDRENSRLVSHMQVDSFFYLPTDSNDGSLLLLQQVAIASSVVEVVYADFSEKVTFSVRELFGLDAGYFYWVE